MSWILDKHKRKNISVYNNENLCFVLKEKQQCIMHTNWWTFLQWLAFHRNCLKNQVLYIVSVTIMFWFAFETMFNSSPVEVLNWHSFYHILSDVCFPSVRVTALPSPISHSCQLALWPTSRYANRFCQMMKECADG